MPWVGLRIHRADHPISLVGALCDLVAEPLGSPFTTECVVVPTRGIERWLTEQIATEFGARGLGDGIAANIEFPFPYRVVEDVLSHIPEMALSNEAWAQRAIVLRLEQIIDEYANEKWMWLITRFVAGPDGDRSDGAQRLGAAQKIQRLFAAYGRYRPAMLDAWSAGKNVGPTGDAIDEAARWQPMLWRVLREQTNVAAPHEALPAAVDALRGGAGTAELPSRISVYGATSLSPVDLAVFDAISSSVDVHLFLLHPSPALWRDSAEVVASMNSGRIGRADDPNRDLARHPILRSWAQDSRELQIMITRATGVMAEFGATTSTAEATSLLGTLQADIRENREPGRFAGNDHSIQIHSCHGARRQVEVLRDAVLHLLNEDSTLEPRDIVIMTPDLDTFAPLIDAVFPANSAAHSGIPDLRVRVADRAPSRTNPLVRFVGTLVELMASRITTSDIAQLIALPEVQRRLGIDSETASEITDLVKDANVRWGLDADHRERNGAGSRDEHTWRRGLDRILTGVFFDDSPLQFIGDIAPLGGIEGDSAVAAGRLALLIERLAAALELLNTPSPTDEWAHKLSTAARLLVSPERNDEWQWGQLDRLLNETFIPESADPVTSMIDLAEVTLLIAPFTEDRPTQLHHRTGNITVCALAPMRSVPYRIVCVVGMDHDKFPRASRNDGDDLIAVDECIADPDRAAQDRQLLLDALMAARDNFIITYAGRDQLTNADYPPAVPIAELRETIVAMLGEEAGAGVVTNHPLQGFSPDVFTADKLGVDGPWGFDQVAHAGAVALMARDPNLIEASPTLSHIESEEPRLYDLIEYLKNPSKTFIKNALGMSIRELKDASDDVLPIDVRGLQAWEVRKRFLEGIQSGTDEDLLKQHERASDAVPAGALSDEILQLAYERSSELTQVAADRGCSGNETVPISGTVTGDGWSLTGSVIANPQAALLCDVSPSSCKASRRLEAHTKLAFLSALEPEREWRAVIVGTVTDTRKSNPREYLIEIATLGPLGDNPEERLGIASEQLAKLVALRNEGMETPLPMFPQTSYAWLSPDKKAKDLKAAWEGSYGGTPGDRVALEVGVLFPELIELADLDNSSFGRYTTELWSPILAITKDDTQ